MKGKRIPEPPRRGGLTDAEIRMLATYNAEVARGIMHTLNWQGKMIALQAAFDQHEQEEAR